MGILVGLETTQALSGDTASWPGVRGVHPASGMWAEQWKGRLEVGWKPAEGGEDMGLVH